MGDECKGIQCNLILFNFADYNLNFNHLLESRKGVASLLYIHAGIRGVFPR